MPLIKIKSGNNINDYELNINKIDDKLNDINLTEDKLNDNNLMEEILVELRSMRSDIAYIKREIDNLKRGETQNIVEIKSELMNIDVDIIKRALKLNGIIGDIILIKYYYFKNSVSPIRNINMRHYEYWGDNKWNIDPYGKNIINIISNNLKTLYISVNTIENFEVDDFMKNQTHIFELNNEKYQKTLLQEIIKTCI